MPASTTASTPRKRPVKRGPGAKAGLPLVIVIIGGAYTLSLFMQTHYEYKDKKDKNVNERKFNIEEEHKKIEQQLNIKEFSLSRIPRPGEDTRILAKDKNKKLPEVRETGRTWVDWWHGK